jgi:hypothetical protein
MKSSRLAVLALGLALAATAQAQLKPSPRSDAAPRLQAPAAAGSAPAAAAPLSNPEFEKAGRTAAHAWLLLLDRKDWGTAWDSASAVFRQSVPLASWMEGVPKLREPFGAFVERELVEIAYKKTLAGRPDGDYVSVQFASKFQKKADVRETVTTVREPDGRWRVTGYTAR